ncbi:hypothetical protein [Streptomyces sp. NPDC007905]|uniref:hypothetical protein n=1 Tax=Streptomyces sp. NPDC007905 TaxID=3364788 RepID=UPI0036E7176D
MTSATGNDRRPDHRAVRDPGRPGRLLPDLRDGDWLDLNPKGYGVPAGAVPADLYHRT